MSIFANTKDGSYPIDNNATEHTVRLLITMCNSMFHFGCNDGGHLLLYNKYREDAGRVGLGLFRKVFR